MPISSNAVIRSDAGLTGFVIYTIQIRPGWSVISGLECKEAAFVSHIYINARFLTQPTTGVQRYALELVRALDGLLAQGILDPSRYRFELLRPRKGRRHDLELKRIPIREVGRLTGHAWEQLELPLHSRGGMLFCPGNTAPLISLLGRQRTVVTVHDLSYRYFPDAYSLTFRTLYRIMTPMIFRNASALITGSNSEKKTILGYYPKAKGKLYVSAYGSISGELLEFLGNDLPSSQARPFVLFVGSLNRRKNLQGFLNAMSIVNQHVEVSAVVAGAGAKAFACGAFEIPENLEGKIEFLGRVDNSQLVGLYRSASCLVFPSFHEGGGLPPTEAMSFGCPVIASAIPPLLERCGNASCYCDPNNPEDIADKILQLYHNEALREELRQQGYHRTTLFSWKKCAQETVSVFDRAMAA